MYCIDQDKLAKSGSMIDKIIDIANDSVMKINDYPVIIPDKGHICGINKIQMYDSQKMIEKHGHVLFYGTDNIHFPMGLFYMEAGLDEIVRLCHVTYKTSQDPIKKAYAEGIGRVYESISHLIIRHAEQAKQYHDKRHLKIAETCNHIAHKSPETFLQAVQLFWFIWTIRSEMSHIHARNQGYYMATIGRMDMQLYPYYQQDISKGILTRDEAYEIICELFEKMNELGSGDTLKNIMLGGQDVDGNDTTNDLSHLFVDAMLSLSLPEPHLNIRLHKNTDPEFVKKCMYLILQGQGQGTVYNDDIVIDGLVRFGLPREVAVNYANDGCEEVLIDREGAILFNEMEAMKCFELACFNGQENPYLIDGDNYRRWSRHLDPRENKTLMVTGYESGKMNDCKSFEEVYDCFIRQYMYQTDIALSSMCENIRFYEEECIGTMVLAGGYRDCVVTGGDPFRDVIPYKCFQLHSGSITPVADALAAIKYHVFEKKTLTMAEIIDAMAKNFEGCEHIRRILLTAPKFGNDNDLPDLIAADIAKKFIDKVKSCETPTGKPIWPGIYSIFFGDHSVLVGATADGRKCGEALAVHFSPMPGRAVNGPTAILHSAAKTHLYDGIAASPVFLTISRNLIPNNDEGAAIVTNIVQAAIDLKLPILSFAINDVETLKKAQLTPEKYGDVIVRVWGFNARFIDLTPQMQEHIILRTLEQ